MKKFALISILLVLFISACKTNTVRTQKGSAEDFGTAKYYQKYQRNIDRLYHLLQGTFVCYVSNEKNNYKPTPWILGDSQDSVIVYSIPIKEPAKDGYWLICYQFISGLPNDPIYSALQKITAIDRDTFLSEFFEPPVKLRLVDMINDLDKLDESINLDDLVPIDEVITYYREDITVFKGFSNIYKDHQKQNRSYRQEDYEIYPNKNAFSTKYFEDIGGKKPIPMSNSKLIGLRTQKNIADMTDKSLLDQ